MRRAILQPGEQGSHVSGALSHNDEVVITTSAPTRRYFTTSSALVTPVLAAREARAPGKYGKPEQREPDLVRLTELEIGQHLQACQIQIGLIETVEQHQGIRARVVQGHGHVADGTEIGTELHRDRDRDRRSHRSQDVEITLLDIAARRRKIGRNEIDIEFEPVRSGLFELFGVGGPALIADSVQAGDHRNPGRLSGPANEFEIIVRSMLHVDQFGKIAETLRPTVVVRGGQMLVSCGFRFDFLLEERRQDQSSGAGSSSRLSELSSPVSGDADATSGFLSESHIARRQIHWVLLGQVALQCG